MSTTPYPLLQRPAFKDAIWGGTRLASLFDKSPDRTARVAESWELSAHPDGPSMVDNGPLAGLTLPEALDALGWDAVRPGYDRAAGFPLLFKLIDAKSDLSVQVHPDDAYAHAHGLPNGKNELWYIVEADPGSKIVYGLNGDCTRGELAAAIDAGTLERHLNYIPVRKGGVYYIPAGTIHAIGGGIVVAELQQNSNTTYRLYDYNRRDDRGDLRELHVGQGLDCAILKKTGAPEQPSPAAAGQCRLLHKCEYFTIEELSLDPDGTRQLDVSAAFGCLMCLDGEAVFNGKWKMENGKLDITAGQCWFIPCGAGMCGIANNTPQTCRMLMFTL